MQTWHPLRRGTEPDWTMFPIDTSPAGLSKLDLLDHRLFRQQGFLILPSPSLAPQTTRHYASFCYFGLGDSVSPSSWVCHR
jgi:hypothetical protein